MMAPNPKEVGGLRNLWSGRPCPPPISYATVREFCEYADVCPSLFGGCQDLKDAQRPWAVKAILASVPPGSSLVEIGGGEPTVAQTLVDLGYEVTVVDPYDGSGNGPVEFEAYRLNYPRVRLVRSLFDLGCPFEESSFDCVYSVSVIEHIPLADLPNLFAAIRKFLRPGGMSLHCIDVVIEGWMTEAMSEGAREIVRLQHELTGQREIENNDAYDLLVANMEGDLETFLLSAHGHNTWRNREPYNRYPFRRVASLQLCGSLPAPENFTPTTVQKSSAVAEDQNVPAACLAASYLDLPAVPPTAAEFTVQAWIAGNQPLKEARLPLQPPVPLSITRRPDVERGFPHLRYVNGIVGCAPAAAFRGNSIEIEFLFDDVWISHRFLVSTPEPKDPPKSSWKTRSKELRQWLDEVDSAARRTGSRDASRPQMEFNSGFAKTIKALAGELTYLADILPLEGRLADGIRRRAQTVWETPTKDGPSNGSQHHWNALALKAVAATNDAYQMFGPEILPSADASHKSSHKLEKRVNDMRSKVGGDRRCFRRWFGSMFFDQRAVNESLHLMLVELQKRVARMHKLTTSCEIGSPGLNATSPVCLDGRKDQ